MQKANDVDSNISAEILPDPETFSEGSEARAQAVRLQEIVLNQMRHGPCGKDFPDSLLHLR